MKNFKRRLLSLALVLILIFSATTVLSGCYVTRSAKMKYVEGTYELTSYSGDSNWLEERGIKLIMVIRSDGTGHYGYVDNEGEPFTSELRCRFINDPENSEKYQYVEIDFEGKGEYHQLGINATIRNQNLNSSKPKWKGNLFEGTAEIDYYVSVGFTRIDRATDTSVIEEHFGEAPFFPAGARRINNTYSSYGLVGIDASPSFVAIPENPFVYFYVDIDLYKNQGKAWYMLKSDERAVEKTFAVSVSDDGNGSFAVKFDSVEILLDKSSWPYGINLIIPYTCEQGAFGIHFSGTGRYSDEQIRELAEDAYTTHLANKGTSE